MPSTQTTIFPCELFHAAPGPGLLGLSAALGRKDPTSWIDALPPQELSSVDPEVAFKVLNRFISAELKYESFDSAEPTALERLEVEVINWCVSIHLGIVSLCLEDQSASYSGFTPQDSRLRESCQQDRAAS